MTTSESTKSYPLTRSQTWVRAGQQLLPDSPMNNMAFAITTPEGTNKEHLLAAIHRMIGHCAAMHLRLTADGERLYPAEEEEAGRPEVEIVFLSENDDPDAGRRAYLTERCATTIFRPEERLYDTALIAAENGAYVWYLNQHHLITDGWGKSLQVRYVFACYEALRTGEPLPVNPFQPYTDYLAAQPPPTANPEYWDAKATTLPPPPSLYGSENPSREDSATRRTFSLGEERAAKLDAVIGEDDVRNWSADLAKFTVFSTVLYAYLYLVSGQRELAIGTPAHNRITKADKQTPGLFMELFPQAVTLEDGETFTSLLQKVKAETMDFLRHAKPGGSTRASNASFNVLLNYINQSFVESGETQIGVEWLHSGHTEPGHHLSVQIYDFEGTGVPKISFDVNATVLGEEFGDTVPNQFMEVFDDFLADRTRPLTRLCTSVRAKKNGSADYPTDKTVVDLFYASAADNAHRTAVISGDQSLTYANLDARSNQLAHHLLGLGVTPEMPVAICLDRSLEMMIGLLGILKAGGAYSPIDPEFPVARIGYLLEDTGAEILVTKAAHYEKLTAIHGGKTLALDTNWPEISGQPTYEPPRRPRPEELIYIIHTSGSTGKPKGVMNQHDGLVNRLHWAQKTFRLEADLDVVLQKTTFCFDVSVWELFWPLLVGVKLVFARPGGHKDDRYLREIIQRESITTLHFVPPMLEVFLEGTFNLPQLKRVLCSGEALRPHQVVMFREKLPDTELHNLYGPTEAAIDVTHWAVPLTGSPPSGVPIGRPIDNVSLYILDGNGMQSPIGVPGELYIGGVQVARGYFGKPELTAEKFVLRKLYADADAERVYATGDLARWLPDGNIDFLGRIDSQVKVRGYRIELGEIEATLLEMSAVARAQVLARGEGQGTILVAYIVTAGAFDPNAAKSFLAERLPAYMVPAQYLVVPEMPLNANGKIDRKALAALAVSGPVAAGEAPETEFEEMIQQLWRDALLLEEIGVTTSFHDIGGHSLSAIRLINRVNEAFELELAANTIFRFPTIRGLAGHVENVIVQLMEEMEDE